MSEMINIKVTGADQVDHAIAQLLHKMQNLQKPFGAVGAYLTNITEESFDNEASPDGHAWHPLKDSTIEARLKQYNSYGGKTNRKDGKTTKHFQKFAANQKILQDSRTLRESIGYSADSDSVIVGVNAYSKDRYPYPIVHQFGTEDGKIEARPFMPITSDGELYDNVNVEVLDILLGYLGE